KFDVDDFATALIKLEGGASVTLDVSWAAHQEEENRKDIRLLGTEAGATLYPTRLYQRDKKGQFHIIQDPQAERIYSHTNRFYNFINHLLDNEPLAATPQQALAVQKILDAIYESSKSGKEVR